MPEQLLEDLLKPTRDNKAALRNRILELREDSDVKTKVTSKALSEAIKVATKDQIDNFIRRISITAVNYAALMQYIWDQRWWDDTWIEEQIAEHPDALYFALCSFYNIRETSRQEFDADVTGTYRLWRSAIHHPGYYILAKLELKKSSQRTKALQSIETHVSRPQKQVAGHTVILEGFIVKKSNYYMIVSRQIAPDTDASHKGAPQIIIIHNANYVDGRICGMHGIVFGCYGTNKFFSTPVYIERVDERDILTLDEELEVRQAIPDSIKAKITVKVSKNVIYF